MSAQTIRSLIAVAVTAGSVFLFEGAKIQAQEITQLKLTEKHVVGLLAAQDDFGPLAGQLAEAADKPSEDLMAKLDATAQKHGFKDFNEYRDVDNNIFLVLEGLDRESGEYVPPKERLAAELEEIEKEASIPKEDKEAIIAEIKEELGSAEAVKYPENVALVKKHMDKLSKLMPVPEDPGLPTPDDIEEENDDDDDGDNDPDLDDAE